MGRLTKFQRAAMRHALGLDKRKTSYRNRYHAPVGSDVADAWAELVSRGLAALVHVENNLALFTVTEAGLAALKDSNHD